MRKALRRLKRRLLGQSPEEEFINLLSSRMAAGWEHSTLGPKIRDEAYTRRKAETWAERMVGYGLQRDHLCVEYGCGSLWAAEPIIRLLEPGRYIGLDITDQFYGYGRERLGALMQEKQVRLGVISESKLREVAALKPDFVFSRKVLPHVAEDALPRFLANVASLMEPKTIAVLDNTPVPGDDGKITGRRYTTEMMQKLLPAGFAIQQSNYGALLRRRS
jgi:hypothetical protein